jgi:predicted nucleic acid-binding protein
VPGELILDTGALVGLLDRSQSVHEACVEFYSTWTGSVVTSEAVLTESTHLLSGTRGGGIACLDFVLRGGVILLPSTDVSLRRCRNLMEKYADLPMDFADATLVVIAEEINTDLVFTIDRDFDLYRIRGRSRFHIVPQVT